MFAILKLVELLTNRVQLVWKQGCLLLCVIREESLFWNVIKERGIYVENEALLQSVNESASE